MARKEPYGSVFTWDPLFMKMKTGKCDQRLLLIKTCFMNIISNYSIYVMVYWRLPSCFPRFYINSLQLVKGSGGQRVAAPNGFSRLRKYNCIFYTCVAVQ